MSDPIPTSDQLLSHVSWMRALARELVSDPDLADDLTQTTFAIALEKGPRDRRSMKSWLRRVLQNLSREDVRRTKNRHAIELRSARVEGLEPTDDLVARMQAQEHIARALLELDEPFRSTLFLRFYDDLQPGEIARRHDVPVATVKSRIHRGLAHMRRRLDQTHGENRQSWVLAVLPLATQLRPETSLLGGVAMNTKLTATALATAALAVTGTWIALDEADAPAEIQSTATPGLQPVSRALSSDRNTPELSDAAVEADAPSSRAAIDEGASVALDNPPGDTAIQIVGRVLDGEGAPLTGMPLRVRGTDTVVATTEAGGRFRFATEADAGSIELADAGWVTVRSGSWSGPPTIDPVVVGARAIDLAGEVVDEWGKALEGAQVHVALPEGFKSRFDGPMDASSDESWRSATNAEGRFALERVPLLAGATLRAAHARYEPAQIELPRMSNDLLLIELALPIVPDYRALRGQVLRADGSPASDATVSFGAATMPTNETGEFTLDLARGMGGSHLVAIEAGHQPAILQPPLRPGTNEADWPERVVLVLGPPALSIRGRVVDWDGQPRADARVWVEGERFGVLGNVPLQREALMAGAKLPDEALEFLASGPTSDGDESFGNHSPISNPNAMLHWVTTDTDGAFEIGGLADRDYVVVVMDPQLRFGTRSAPIAAGTRGATIELSEEGIHPFVAGQIVTRSGDAVGGVSLHPFFSAVDDEIRLFGGRAQVSRNFVAEAVVADEEGFFELESVPHENIAFYVASDAIVPRFVSIEEVDDPSDFEIVVAARVHLSVELLDPARADAFSVTDSWGEPITIRTVHASGHTTFQALPISEGRSETCVVSTEAVQLHLMLGGFVVESHPVTLSPGEVNTLRF